jgi:hypothetical protein
MEFVAKSGERVVGVATARPRFVRRVGHHS